jgi:hypothetical protein
VSSTGRVCVGSVGLGFVENCAIVSEIDAPRVASPAVMSLMGDEPLQEVSILVFDVLTKHPNEAPLDFSVLHRNCRSSRYTQVEMSSTYDYRWEMPPWPSSPGSPEASRVAARSRSNLSIGARRRATMNKANSEQGRERASLGIQLVTSQQSEGLSPLSFSIPTYCTFGINLQTPNWGQIHRDPWWANQHFLWLRGLVQWLD